MTPRAMLSWLIPVEIWFSEIQRDLLDRGIFESKIDLPPKIVRYIRHYNKAALPLKWTDKRFFWECRGILNKGLERFSDAGHRTV